MGAVLDFDSPSLYVAQIAKSLAKGFDLAGRPIFQCEKADSWDLPPDLRRGYLRLT
jgi:hypothetical protein